MRKLMTASECCLSSTQWGSETGCCPLVPLLDSADPSLADLLRERAEEEEEDEEEEERVLCSFTVDSWSIGSPWRKSHGIT